MSHREVIKILIAISIILVAGCVSTGPPISINEQRQTDTSDILVVENVATYPSQPITPGSKFTFSFDVRNVHGSAIAKCLHVRLYDYNIFKILENNDDPSKRCGSYQEPYPEEVVDKGDIYPGVTTRISYKLQAPTTDEISNLRITPTIRYRLTYEFTANTLYQIVVVDGDYLAKMEQAGKSVTASPINSIGPGPFKIYMSLMNKDKMVLAGSTGQIKIEIKNEGSGSSSSDFGRSIRKNALVIGIPSDIVKSFDFSGAEGKFVQTSCPQEFGTGYTCVTNSDKIHLFQGSSSPLIFRFEAGEINDPNNPNVVPYRIYTFRAKMDYQYLIDKEYQIEVNPHVVG